MSHLHFDCASGVAGDMFLGACLDLGVPLEALEESVAGLGVDGLGVESRRARRGGLDGIRFRVLLHGVPVEGPDPEEAEAPADAAPERKPGGGGRDLDEILDILRRAVLPAAVRERTESLFRRLAEAEAKAHGVPTAAVHFHELGALDAIVDLVGAATAMEHLRPDSITCTALNLGGGTVHTAHGELPVPTPATCHLLAGVPVYGSAVGELVTPTGAVLVAEFVDRFGDLPELELEDVGCGLGRREIEGRPNAFRIFRGRRRLEGREVAVIETQVDDLSGEGFGFTMERLFEEGAVDVFFTPVQMKKGRPGTLVTLLCRPADIERLSRLLLLETGSLGCRVQRVRRIEAEREEGEVETPYGAVRVKRARLAGRSLAVVPEYEDCRRRAREAGVPWRIVYQAALVRCEA